MNDTVKPERQELINRYLRLVHELSPSIEWRIAPYGFHVQIDDENIHIDASEEAVRFEAMHSLDDVSEAVVQITFSLVEPWNELTVEERRIVVDEWKKGITSVINDPRPKPPA